MLDYIIKYIKANPVTDAAIAVLSIFVLLFLLRAYKDILLLVRRPKGMGMGISRIWAIGRTAVYEAWYARVWVVPIIWFLACLVISLVIKPYDETERLGLHLQVLLRGQELLVLVVLAMLACFSLPRERERRTIITTGSKPISRLELFLGKSVGFITVGGLLLLIMGTLTWGWMQVLDWQTRNRAHDVYELQQSDFVKGLKPAPSEGLKRIAENGMLEARNYVTPASRLQVAGRIEYTGDKSIRYLKGGSSERVNYLFGPLWATPMSRPFFTFQYEVFPTPGNELPEKVQIQVTVTPYNNRLQGAMKEITRELVQPEPVKMPGIYVNNWAPEGEFALNVGPAGTVPVAANIFSYGANNGPVSVQVQCVTNNVFLRIRECKDINDANVMAVNLDPKRVGETGVIAPMPNPRMLGFEKRDMQQVEGPDPKTVPLVNFDLMTRDKINAYMNQFVQFQEVASWRFNAADLKKVPVNYNDGTFTISMHLDVEKNKNSNSATFAAVTIYNMLTLEKRELKHVAVWEKRVTEVKIPASFLTSNEDLYVDVRCATPGHWIGARDDSVRLEQPSSLFILNLAKSELVIFLEASLLVVIAVVASIRLGGWVSILTTLVCFLLGNLFEYVQGMMSSGSYSIFSPSDQKEFEGSLIFMAVNQLHAISVKMLYILVNVMPDFRIFDPLKFIVDSRNMPWWDMGVNAFWTLLYILPVIAIGYLIIRKQELA